MVHASPFADVHKPRAAKREPCILDATEIEKLRTALDVPFEKLLVELTLTNGMRSGEVRGLSWDSIDLEGRRLFIERQANRLGFIGSPGRITRSYAPRPCGVALRAIVIAAALRCRRTGLVYVGGSNFGRWTARIEKRFSKFF